MRTRARIRRTSDPQEPLPGTLAADETAEQGWDGIELPASTWCAEEVPYMKLREFKHSYGERDRVPTLLTLEDTEPRPWDQSSQDGESFDSYDQFVSNGQMPTRWAPRIDAMTTPPVDGELQASQREVQPPDASRRRRSDSARASASNWPQPDGGRPPSSILRNTR
ncbi:hypothetical protein Tther_02520 [Tepidimonas thermarum]|uniref:Uncharacterized protein n=1 Tax=Tepidimonas thermarum TaxID=335431 RepID=A0A554WVP6_9BURK|nr:hypothetical protein Tther_02520 [Tepidimonas thermarum]